MTPVTSNSGCGMTNIIEKFPLGGAKPPLAHGLLHNDPIVCIGNIGIYLEFFPVMKQVKQQAVRTITHVGLKPLFVKLICRGGDLW